MKPETTYPIITTQTGLDEAFIIGTREELIAFANSILDAVQDVKPDVFFGVNAHASDLISGSLDSISQVRIDWLVVAKTPEEKREIFYKVYNS
jgi:hypothetical protein